jgi:hypothetical protein
MIAPYFNVADGVLGLEDEVSTVYPAWVSTFAPELSWEMSLPTASMR